MEKYYRALNCNRSRLMKLENVVGVGVGLKEKGGRWTGEYAVTVLVTKKRPREELQAIEVVPMKLGNVQTDVLEVGELVALSLPRTDKWRPAPGGVSIGHFRTTAGTLGAVVYDLETSEPLILSNNHVLANTTNGVDGRAKVGDPILQPGRYDGGEDSDVIAHLLRFVPVFFEEGESQCRIARRAVNIGNMLLRRVAPSYRIQLTRINRRRNLIDAAVARPISPEVVIPEILEIGEVKGVGKVAMGSRVRKSGRTSGITEGRIKVMDASLKIYMGDLGYAVFHEQCVTTPIAKPGDSGSLVIDEGGKAIGLLSAGSDSASIFGKIDHVTRLLGVTLLRNEGK